MDNEFFVPHGHLSDEEIEHEDENPEDNSPETQKAKLKIMQQEFAAEMKKKTEKIKPRLIGCVWVKNNAEESDDCSPIVWEILQARAMLINEPVTLDLSDPVDETAADIAPKKIPIKEEGIPDLIRLVHGNPNSRKFLIEEYGAFRRKTYGEQEDFCEFGHVGSKLKEMSEYRQGTETENGLHKVSAWFVKNEFLEKYDLKSLTLPNTWEYTLTPTRISVSKQGSHKTTPSTRKVWTVTEEAMPKLIRLVHGNTHSRKFLVKEFTAFRKQTYGHLEDFKEFCFVGSRIKRIAVWKQRQEEPMQGKYAWFVHDEVLQRYNLIDLPLPNTWTYTLDPTTSSSKPKKPIKLDMEASKENITEQKATNTVPSIEKFAVIMSQNDKKKQFDKLSENKPITPQVAPEQSQQSSTPTATVPTKKRVQLLMSVPRGQTIPEAKKNSLIKHFLNKGGGGGGGGNSEPVDKSTPMDIDKDDVIVIE